MRRTSVVASGMRIGIDCHTIGSGIGGNENYTFHLVRALARVDPYNEYHLYVTRLTEATRSLVIASNFKLIKISPHTPLLRIPVSLPLELWRHPIDVLHVQYIPPPFGRTPIVNMVHDLSAIHLPQFFTRREVWRNRFLFPRAIRRSAKLLTVSRYCREEIVRTYGVDSAEVVVDYPGVSEHFRRIEGSKLEAVLRKYGVTVPYLLYVGNIQPRKNLRGLLEAFALLKRHEGITHKLVVVGRKAWLYSDVFARVRELALERELVFTSYVPYEDLPALYSGADALVYPSFFEGFGSPPLEAMLCETPVVVSDRPAFPEILGDSAMLVDPSAPADIARGMLAVIRDDALRQRLVARGVARAKSFRWEEAAR